MQDDKLLIERLKRNDEKAFVELMKRHQDYVYSIVYNILKNPNDAQEAAQDSFVKIHRSIKEFKEGAKLSTWIYKIAYRTALDHYKKNKNTRLTGDIENTNAGLEDLSTSAQAEIEHLEQKHAIKRAIAQLKTDETAVVNLFYLKEMSLKEIAEITELSESNVKVKLFRARQSLYQLMKNNYEFQPNY